jgi:type IV pilus assembly protein PilQ
MKRKIVVALFISTFLMLAGCATTENQEADVTEDTVDAPQAPAADSTANAGAADTTEQDLAQQAAEQTPPPAEALPPPETAAAEPPPPVEPPPTEAPPAEPVDQGPPARVTGLDYNANLNGGTVIVKTNRPVQFSTRRNGSTNQFIIELQNTSVPAKFRRPYNTKEFGGPIASINAYQAKGAGKTARIVVQMRDATEPAVNQDGNVINVASAGGPPPAQAEVEPPPPAEEETPDNGEEPVAALDEKVLSNRSLGEFLTGNSKFYGRPISLEIKDWDIRDVFRFISEEVGLNIVVGEDVTGKVSLKLRKIPWDQALTVILQSKQLGYVKQGNILRIAKLQTLQAESDSARTVMESQRLLQPLRVQLFPVSYAKVEEIELQAKDFLSTRGKAKGDKRTNTLVVTDIEENLARIKALVQRLDTQTPQVLIEAKVVEARESFSRLVGVNWGFTGNPSVIGQNATGGDVNLTPKLNSNPSTATSALDLGLTVGTLDVFGDLNASLKLLEIERLVKVISSPRIVTLDRVDAQIEQTTQFPIFSSSTSTTTGTSTSSVSFQDVRLQLSVKPQITIEGGIIMDVNILREFPEPATRIGGSEARAVNKRQAKTQVLVENGDTVVIGGIYQSDVSESETGVPWLRKIPILGALFKQRGIERDKNELVIFLTPRVLNREKAFSKNQEGEGQ